MPYRKVPLAEGNIYHVFTRSIAGYKIFNSDMDFKRMFTAIAFYTSMPSAGRISDFFRGSRKQRKEFPLQNYPLNKKIRLIAYCIMPTHIHLLLHQLGEESISRYINLVLKSYSKYFNLKHKRLGPLWESRFKNVIVESDEQLIHLTRYIHLNPVTAYLVDRPEDWRHSSYQEYLKVIEDGKGICDYSGYVAMGSNSYRNFTNDQIDYQRKLQDIKKLILE